MSKLIKTAFKIERVIIYTLLILIAIVLVLATIDLAYYVILSIVKSEFLLIGLDALMDLFGVFLLVLIGIELLDTVKVYLKEKVVHVEVVVLVAIIALARKVVVMKVEEFSGDQLLGIAALILGLAVGYYLIKKAGLMVCDLGNPAELRTVLQKTLQDDINLLIPAEEIQEIKEEAKQEAKEEVVEKLIEDSTKSNK